MFHYNPLHAIIFVALLLHYGNVLLQVDFDKTKHLSEKGIQKRNIEREKLIHLEREREERVRRERDEEERKREEEK